MKSTILGVQAGFVHRFVGPKLRSAQQTHWDCTVSNGLPARYQEGFVEGILHRVPFIAPHHAPRPRAAPLISL